MRGRELDFKCFQYTLRLIAAWTLAASPEWTNTRVPIYVNTIEINHVFKVAMCQTLTET